MAPVELLALGMMTPVGLTAPSTAAAVRAGIKRVRETPLEDRHGEPLVMGVIDEARLPPLAPACEAFVDRAPRAGRLLRIAAPALREALAGGSPPGPVPVLLGLPEVEPGLPDFLARDFVERLAVQSGVRLDLGQSRIFRRGRAAGLSALQQAVAALGSGRTPLVVVGGVDSYFCPELLAGLDREGRLHTGPVRDGFIPGEGAAFLVLAPRGTASRRGRKPIAWITGAAVGSEPGHLYSAEVYRGEGLAETFRVLLADARPRRRIGCVYAGLNGESFWTKEWGVAALRCGETFAERAQIEHPVENIGDPGAALGPWMVGLAAMGIQRGYRDGTCLVWCASDRAERGAALVQDAPE